MAIVANPFTDLYTTESISAQRFVKVFSPVLLTEPDVLALYQPGNVILSGLQGSGKSALLNLLRPEVLIAYLQQGVEWPLPPSCAKFISGGINLAKSGAMDFGQREVEPQLEGHPIRLALHFTDFLNAWIVDDLFSSIETIANAENTGACDFLGLNVEPERLDKFSREYSVHSSWVDGIGQQSSFATLREAIAQRIIEYRKFLNFNTTKLPDRILSSKTSAGEPISAAVELLRKYSILPDDLPVFIRIDQFEDLIGLEESDDRSVRLAYRAAIFKMFAARDSRLSYRVGARPYAISDDLQVLASTTSIEELRNYTVVEIEQILERREHKVGLFPSFAEDVFRRRLQVGGYKRPNTKERLTDYVFGRRQDARSRARQYAKSAGVKFVNESDIGQEVGQFLNEIAGKDPLSAKFGEAFVRQLKSRGRAPDLEKLTTLPWESPSKQWWRKERTEHALLQIAAERRQKMVWSGKQDVLNVSGGNILIFLSICQLIWAEYLRSTENPSEEVPAIESTIVQDLGIQQASEYWYRKLRADSNGGDDRQRFVDVVASDLRRRLREDKRMSYPGATGFSLPVEILEKYKFIRDFLDRCCSYGALTSSRHTSKNTGQGESKKWYIFPVHCPYFQLPAQRIKEPVYADLEMVVSWIRKAGVVMPEGFSDGRGPAFRGLGDGKVQMSLFGESSSS